MFGKLYCNFCGKDMTELECVEVSFESIGSDETTNVLICEECLDAVDKKLAEAALN